LNKNSSKVKEGLPNSRHFRVDILNVIDFGVRDDTRKKIEKVDINDAFVSENEDVEEPTHEFS